MLNKFTHHQVYVTQLKIMSLRIYLKWGQLISLYCVVEPHFNLKRAACSLLIVSRLWFHMEESDTLSFQSRRSFREALSYVNLGAPALLPTAKTKPSLRVHLQIVLRKNSLRAGSYSYNLKHVVNDYHHHPLVHTSGLSRVACTLTLSLVR